jgi:hypothetical protein
MPCYE